jgi:hypothetical protein
MQGLDIIKGAESNALGAFGLVKPLGTSLQQFRWLKLGTNCRSTSLPEPVPNSALNYGSDIDISKFNLGSEQ